MNRYYRLVALLNLVLVLSVLPSGAAAQCSEGAANDDVDIAIRSFGWYVIGADTLLIRSGNSFLIDCDAHLQTIAATIGLPSYTRFGVESLAAGDLVRCEVFDGSRNLIMTEIVPIPDAGFQFALSFDFSDRPFRLAAGQYHYMLTPVGRRWGHMRLGTEYADGAYQQDLLDNWGEQSGDAMFNITWDPTSGLVATRQSSWGGLKARYR